MKQLPFLILMCMSLLSCSKNNGITAIVPTAPQNLTANSVSTNQINLTWTDNSSNEDGFKIERKTPDGSYALAGTTGANTTTFNDQGLLPDQDYTYRLYAYNSAGNSQLYSNEATATTQSNCSLSIANLYGTYKITSVKYQYNAQSQKIEQFTQWPACMQNISYVFYQNNGGAPWVTSLWRIDRNTPLCQGQQPFNLPKITMINGGGGGPWTLVGNTIQWKDFIGNDIGQTIINSYCTFFRFTEYDNSGSSYTYTMKKQ